MKIKHYSNTKLRGTLVANGCPITEKKIPAKNYYANLKCNCKQIVIES